MNNTLQTTATHVDTHIEAMRRTLRVVLEELMEAQLAPANLETLIAALLCNGVTVQEIAFLIAESTPLPSATPSQSNTVLVEVGEFLPLRHESVN